MMPDDSAPHSPVAKTRLARAMGIGVLLACLALGACKMGGNGGDAEAKAKLQASLWIDGAINAKVVAQTPQFIGKFAGFDVPEDARFFIVPETGWGPDHPFSGEKMTVTMALYRAKDIDEAIALTNEIQAYQGQGHSCGIYSFDADHIHRLAMAAPVSRIMVRQPQSKANAGAFNNGMPMTSSLGCGTWGGNIISENVHLKHYMNTTWVSVPIKEDKPSDEELFGSFYDPALEAEVETITT